MKESHNGTMSVKIPARINLYITVKHNKFIRSNNGRALHMFFNLCLKTHVHLGIKVCALVP